MIHFVLLACCAVAIYLSCEWFVNAVEWLGRRLRVGPLAVGTILAAVGTALPESVVTFVAVVFGAGDEQRDLGVGAAMGGPLALATIAYGVTGWMLLARRRRGGAAAAGAADGEPRDGAGHGDARHDDGRHGDLAGLARDQRWFMAIFLVKVSLGLVAFAVKPWLGLLFFAAYAAYFLREVRAGGGPDAQDDDPRPLRLQPRRAVPATWAVATQTVAALAVIFVASQLFVRQLDVIGPMLGLPATVTALLLSPVATELPEVMNAVIWVRQGRPRLALANISGAMMIQATVPSGLGLLFTPWRFDTALVVSGAVTMVAVGYLYTLLRVGRFRGGTLAWAAAFYPVFAVPVLALLW